MKATVIPASELSPAQVDAWSQIQRASAEFGSPYFRPEFTQAVAAVRSDVEVAVLEEGGELAGFFPYQRSHGDVARPVGGRLSDFHGVVVRADVAWNAEQLLRSCRLKAWHFDHLLASQEPLRPYHRLVEDSPYVDLSGGFAACVARRGRQGDNAFPHIARKSRKLEQQAGPLRFEADTRDPRVFDIMVQWKTAQYLRTNVTDVFAFPWTRALLERIFCCRSEAFAGELCALYAGDRLAAVHFGMRSYAVLHLWFPSYDTAWAKFSPGLIRDLELLRAAAARGVRRVDYGKGMTEQKQYFMSGASRVAEGSVDLRPLSKMMRRQWRRAYEVARHSPLRAPARAPARVLYRLREWLAFR
jgi:CelD/BcsL family acetyltransferase involved in cellulose biosynthesis